jgi:predicted aspartyl protease
MKYKVLSLLIFLGSFSLSSQTRNYDQELCDLLFGKRFEESIEFFSQYEDSIYHPFTKDSYKLLSNIHLNNPDSVFQQLTSYIENYYGNIIDDNFLIYFLPFLYFDSNDYVNGLRMIDFLEPFFYGKNEGAVKYFSSIRSRVPIYNFEVVNESETDEVHIPLKQSTLFLIDAKYNETTLNTILDTGCGLPLLTDKETADRAGIRVGEDFTMNGVNGERISAAYAWVDSVRIGPLLITDVPVFVFEHKLLTQFTADSILNNKERKEKIDSLTAAMHIIIGLPIMQKLNHIRFDLSKNDMIVSLNRKDPDKNGSNMYIDLRRFYLDLNINGIDTVAFLDTGANLGETAIFISNRFFQTHADKFPAVINEESGKGLKLHSGITQEMYDKMVASNGTDKEGDLILKSEANVSVGGITLDLPPKTVAFDDLLPQRSDIFLTLKFIQEFNIVTFDFHNMLFSGEIKNK